MQTCCNRQIPLVTSPIDLLTLYHKCDPPLNPEGGRVRDRDVDHHGKVRRAATVWGAEDGAGVDT